MTISVRFLSFPFRQFLHRVVDSLCDREPDWVKSFGNVDAAVQGCRDFVVAAVGNKWDKTQVAAALTEAGIDASLTPIVQKVLDVRGPEVRAALLERVSGIFPLSLKDIDWSVRLVLSSDKVSNMRSVVLVLTLVLKVLDSGNKERTKSVKLELSKEELDKVIASLSKAQEIIRDNS